mmetsp:Transcript_38227/g.89876  ORF Transcript_38227/g.89876 Transcript_38227/m.89876 type:complete len:200 (+) Transcript_38227:492-1091(+)
MPARFEDYDCVVAQISSGSASIFQIVFQPPAEGSFEKAKRELYRSSDSASFVRLRPCLRIRHCVSLKGERLLLLPHPCQPVLFFKDRLPCVVVREIPLFCGIAIARAEPATTPCDLSGTHACVEYGWSTSSDSRHPLMTRLIESAVVLFELVHRSPIDPPLAVCPHVNSVGFSLFYFFKGKAVRNPAFFHSWVDTLEGK